VISLAQSLEQGRFGSIILILWHFTYDDNKSGVKDEELVFYAILFLGTILFDTIGI
jgi:hypothetical protein